MLRRNSYLQIIPGGVGDENDEINTPHDGPKSQVSDLVLITTAVCCPGVGNFSTSYVLVFVVVC